jgi:hypothetical protein
VTAFFGAVFSVALLVPCAARVDVMAKKRTVADDLAFMAVA